MLSLSCEADAVGVIE